MSNPSIYQSWRKRLNLLLCVAAAGMILSILVIGLGGFTAWQPFGTWTVFAFGLCCPGHCRGHSLGLHPAPVSALKGGKSDNPSVQKTKVYCVLLGHSHGTPVRLHFYHRLFPVNPVAILRQPYGRCLRHPVGCGRPRLCAGTLQKAKAIIWVGRSAFADRPRTFAAS